MPMVKNNRLSFMLVNCVQLLFLYCIVFVDIIFLSLLQNLMYNSVAAAASHKIFCTPCLFQPYELTFCYCGPLIGAVGLHCLLISDSWGFIVILVLTKLVFGSC